MTYLTKTAGLLPQLNEELEDVLHEVGHQGHCEDREVYHLGENNYSFDALQAYCFGINIKL